MHDGNYRASHACQKASGRQKRSKRNMRYGTASFRPVERLIRMDLSPEQAVGVNQLLRYQPVPGRKSSVHDGLAEMHLTWKDDYLGR